MECIFWRNSVFTLRYRKQYANSWRIEYAKVVLASCLIGSVNLDISQWTVLPFSGGDEKVDKKWIQIVEIQQPRASFRVDNDKVTDQWWKVGKTQICSSGVSNFKKNLSQKFWTLTHGFKGLRIIRIILPSSATWFINLLSHCQIKVSGYQISNTISIKVVWQLVKNP